ncbi:MAG: hypothetical protein ACR2PC_05100 [Tsuneonella suprasediminis]|nr:hypothetical protein LBX01_14880 [Altererythrobacter sp. N1]
MASMSFREKSAWAMMAVMLLSGLLYFNTVSADPGAPVAVALVPYVLVVVVASVLVQVMLAITAPREANSAADERERLVADRAGRWSGTVLAVGVVLAGGAYLWMPNGNMLFHHAMFALIAAQLADYAGQVYLLRRTV